MPRGAGRLTALLGLSLVLAGACTTNEAGAGGCKISRQAVLPATPLTMLPDARLDTVADGYMLSGVTDRGLTIRWAPVDVAGAMGLEQSLAITAAAGGPWLAFTSDKEPGDTLLVAQAVANGADAELRIRTVPANGAPTPPPGPALAVVAGGAGAPPTVAIAATRTGEQAVLAWVDVAASAVRLLTLSPTGQAVGEPVTITPARGVECLAFAPGKKDLTLVYYRHDDPTLPTPTLAINELVGGAFIDGPLDLRLASHSARCPRLVATDAGYALAFQDNQGAWLGTYSSATNRLRVVPFAQALAFGSAELQPPIAGLAPAGADHVVVFSRLHNGEQWRIGASGNLLGVLPYPTAQGRVGTVSTQPVPGGLTATYADYTATDGGVGVDGTRFFLGTTCL